MEQARRGWAIAAVVAAIGCRHGYPTRPVPLQGRATTLAPLLSMVPADAGVVAHVAPGMAELFPAAAGEDITRGLREDLDEQRAAGHGLAAALIEQMLAGDGAVARTIGWRPGVSEVVAWAEGKTLVIRARLDGAALRASFERAEASSGDRVQRRTWRDRTYAIWLLDHHRELIARTSDDELVVVWGDQPDHDVEVLMDDGPAAHPFDTGQVVATLFPGRADAHFGMMFDPGWVVSIAGEEWGKEGAGCRDAIGRLLAAVPPIDYAWAHGADETEVAAAMRLAPATAARLQKGLAPIPRWPVDDRYATMGFGLSLAAAADVALPWLEQVEEAASSCGQSMGMMSAVRMIAAMPLVSQLERGAAIMDPRNEAIAFAIKPTAIAGYWAALRTLLPPLRLQPPAAGERIEMPQLLVTSDGESLFATQGRPIDEPLLAELKSARPGPAVLFAMVMGDGVLQAFADDKDDEDAADFRRMLGWISGMTIEVGLQRDHLTSRIVFRHR